MIHYVSDSSDPRVTFVAMHSTYHYFQYLPHNMVVGATKVDLYPGTRRVRNETEILF